VFDGVGCGFFGEESDLIIKYNEILEGVNDD
jgi:hypothetical protein